MVKQVKFHCETLACVGHPVEEPLGMAFGVDVIGKHEVVLLITDLEGHAKIARLKPRLEHKSPIILIIRGVIGEHYGCRIARSS